MKASLGIYSRDFGEDERGCCLSRGIGWWLLLLSCECYAGSDCVRDMMLCSNNNR